MNLIIMELKKLTIPNIVLFIRFIAMNLITIQLKKLTIPNILLSI